MRSLAWKLAGALILVVVISVGLMAYLTNQNTAREFRQYVVNNNLTYIQGVGNNLSAFYTRQQSWNGVQGILPGLLRLSTDRLIVANVAGTIVGDTAGSTLSQNVDRLSIANSGTSVLVSGRQVGSYYYLSSGTAGQWMMGMGGPGMMGMMGGTDQTVIVETAETDFLSRINRYFWIAGMIALGAALLLGILLTRQITRPVRALTTGAEQITKGNLGYRVEVSSRDEIGGLARSFNSMAAGLDKSEQSRKQLVSDVSHELRTPLTIIEGTVDGIMDGVFLADREHLNSIKEQTAMLTHLVSDLRDLSLAESGSLKLDLSAVNMPELVRRKLFQFGPQAEAKAIRLTLEAQAEGLEIRGDSTRLEQILANLLSNAIRHTPQEGQITVGIKKSDLEPHLNGPGLVVSVADTGEGIPAEHLAHIFERFYRVENSRSRREGGVGLGLAIVKQMVQAHGGRVWAESEAGKGSTFYVALPVG